MFLKPRYHAVVQGERWSLIMCELSLKSWWNLSVCALEHDPVFVQQISFTNIFFSLLTIIDVVSQKCPVLICDLVTNLLSFFLDKQTCLLEYHWLQIFYFLIVSLLYLAKFLLEKLSGLIQLSIAKAVWFYLGIQARGATLVLLRGTKQAAYWWCATDLEGT